MADLDSFFNKKDKKKAKFKGKKFGNPEEIAKQFEERERKEKERLKAEPKMQLDEVLSSASTDPVKEVTAEKEEEEWKDFEESKDDLQNLKISRLQIENEEDGIGGGGSGEEEGIGGLGDKLDGVWNKNIEHQPIPVVETVMEPPKEEETEKPQNTSLPSSSYVPPALRNQQSSALPRLSSRKPKQAPDITNELSFPSLSDSQTASPTSAWGRKKIQPTAAPPPPKDEKYVENVSVRQKYSAPKVTRDLQGPPKLATANRFQALSDNS